MALTRRAGPCKKLLYAIDVIKVTITENYTLAEMTAIVDRGTPAAP